jgi:glucose/arabinose dehydrogenase
MSWKKKFRVWPIAAAVLGLLVLVGCGLALRQRLAGYVFRPTPGEGMTPGVTWPPVSAPAIEESGESVTVVADGLSVPWEIAFLPNGDLLVTERTGQLVRIGRERSVIPIEGVAAIGEGGLMGLALSPDFATTNHLYMMSDTRREDGTLVGRVERYRLAGDAVLDRTVIIDDLPAAVYHDGGRVAFGPDGKLYVTVGDATAEDLASDRGTFHGTTLRLEPDGSVPADNPFGTAVWTYGHRNHQGLAWDDAGRLWSVEHGRSGLRSGFDEINLLVRGGNYGWPDSEGDEAAAGTLGPARHSGAAETWAPADVAWLGGRLFFTGLRGETLYEATVDEDGSIKGLRGHFRQDFGRLRAVAVGPDGFLYVSTSNTDGRGTAREGDDRILRIDPRMFE